MRRHLWKWSIGKTMSYELYFNPAAQVVMYFSPHWSLLPVQVVKFDKTQRNWVRLTSLVIMTRNMFFLTSVFMRCLRANSNSLVFSLAANDVASNSLSILSNDEPVIHQRPTSKSILLRLSIWRFLSLTHWNYRTWFLDGQIKSTFSSLKGKELNACL